MTVKVIMLAALLIIVVSLGSALFHLVAKKGSEERMVRALTIRIGLSLALLIFIIAAAALGWITPHSALPISSGG